MRPVLPLMPYNRGGALSGDVYQVKSAKCRLQLSPVPKAGMSQILVAPAELSGARGRNMVHHNNHRPCTSELAKETKHCVHNSML